MNTVQRTAKNSGIIITDLGSLKRMFFMTFKKIVEEQKTEQLMNLSLIAYDNPDIVIYEDLWFAKLFKQIAMKNELVKGLITKIIVKGSNRIPKMTAWHYC